MIEISIALNIFIKTWRIIDEEIDESIGPNTSSMFIPKCHSCGEWIAHYSLHPMYENNPSRRPFNLWDLACARANYLEYKPHPQDLPNLFFIIPCRDSRCILICAECYDIWFAMKRQQYLTAK
jgi:hypothetical protein